MAQAVEQALEEKRHLIVEAGTGTGKTLAYLVPVFRSGKRVIISTGTKTLQEQLFYKDIPFLEQALFPKAEDKLNVSYMKGRNNYLCRKKLFDLTDQPVLAGLDESSTFVRLLPGRRQRTPAIGPNSPRCRRPVRSGTTRCTLRNLPGPEVQPVRTLLHHRNASPGDGERHHHRQPSPVFRRSRDQAGPPSTRPMQASCRKWAR